MILGTHDWTLPDPYKNRWTTPDKSRGKRRAGSGAAEERVSRILNLWCNIQSLSECSIMDGSKIYCFIEEAPQDHTPKFWVQLLKFIEEHFMPGDAEKVLEEFLKANEVKSLSRFPFEEGTPEFTRKKASVNKLPVSVLKKVCFVLGVEQGGTKKDIVDRIMNFLLNPQDFGEKVPSAKMNASKEKKINLKKTESDQKSNIEKTDYKASEGEDILGGTDEEVEDKEICVLKEKIRKLWGTIYEHRAQEEFFKEKIKSLEDSEDNNQYVLSLVNRYWNQLDDAIINMMENLQLPISDDLKREVEKETSLLTQEVAEEKIKLRINISTEAIYAIFQRIKDVGKTYEKIIEFFSRKSFTADCDRVIKSYGELTVIVEHMEAIIETLTTFQKNIIYFQQTEELLYEKAKTKRSDDYIKCLKYDLERSYQREEAQREELEACFTELTLLRTRIEGAESSTASHISSERKLCSDLKGLLNVLVPNTDEERVNELLDTFLKMFRPPDGCTMRQIKKFVPKFGIDAEKYDTEIKKVL